MTVVTNTLINVAYRPLATADELVHPLLRRLHDDWSAAAQAALPGHDFIDPLKLSYLLSHLLVVEVKHGADSGPRFFYRLIGTALVDRLQKDYTGRWMDEHQDQAVATTGTAACRLAVETLRPVRVTAVRLIDEGRYPLEYLLLPLVDTAAHIDRLLIAQLYPENAPHLPYKTGS